MDFTTPPTGLLEPAVRHPAEDDPRHTVAPALTGARAFLTAPVAPATWRAVSQATIGFPVLLVAGIYTLVLAPLAIGLIPVFGVGLPLLAITLAGARWFAGVERSRLHAQLGVTITPGLRRPTPSLRTWAGWRAALTEPVGWSSLGYSAAAMGLVCVQVCVAWGLGLVLALLLSPVIVWEGNPSRGQLALFALGIASPWLWAVACQGLALAQVRLARTLLSRSSLDADLARAEADAAAARADAERAQQRAEHLTETRTRAVGAADEDRRRIERDLHDGAQQRLVALGVNLGTAKRAAATDPAAATAALDHAHREIKETLAELRDLVRGIHPAVLTDRGLDAALSAIAARHPVPVTVEVPDAAALAATSPGAQAAAYFVAAEALTNSARHAEATHARVRAEVVGDLLRLVVADDGRGGAHTAPGGGLDGLRSRVAALDGTFLLDSPTGLGTTLTVEVSCAS